jgi:hypothetical protein
MQGGSLGSAARRAGLATKALLIAVMVVTCASLAGPASAQVSPGDQISSANAAKIKDLVSPGVYQLVTTGVVSLKVVPTQSIDWPPPYRDATEKYSAQVSLSPDHKSLVNYTAGLPFPKIDPNDPNAAIKAIWNSQFRPGLTDDYDVRFTDCNISKGGETLESIQFGHYAGYSLVGRIEVQPTPTDPDFKDSNRYWIFGLYPILQPAELRGGSITRTRFADPAKPDESWVWNPGSRRLRQVGEEMLRDTSGLGWAPDRYMGFNSKVEEFDYKLLGQKKMLGCFHAVHSPASACAGNDPGCAESWEMRNLYAVEATPKASGSRTIVYLDSETWFSPYLDTYQPSGALEEEDVYLLSAGNRSNPQANVAVYPFIRQFAVTGISFDTREGVLTKCNLPGADTQDTEGWYINMGTVDKEFFTTKALERAAH